MQECRTLCRKSTRIIGKQSAGNGKNKLLWMIGELGEVIDIVKKNGGDKACAGAELRRRLVEELADVLMYYNDVLLCYTSRRRS
jgi:NTP pyrophosphatase (non-canonical NTP hydrolase)